MDLHKKKCVPCRGDIPPFTREQIDEYLKYLADWKVLIGIKNFLKNNKILLQIEIFDNNFKKINKLLLKQNFKLINKFHKTSDYFYINH